MPSSPIEHASPRAEQTQQEQGERFARERRIATRCTFKPARAFSTGKQHEIVKGRNSAVRLQHFERLMRLSRRDVLKGAAGVAALSAAGGLTGMSRTARAQ